MVADIEDFSINVNFPINIMTAPDVSSITNGNFISASPFVDFCRGSLAQILKKAG